MITPDSTYEWRRKGEHVTVIGIRQRHSGLCARPIPVPAWKENTPSSGVRLISLLEQVLRVEPSLDKHCLLDGSKFSRRWSSMRRRAYSRHAGEHRLSALTLTGLLSESSAERPSTAASGTEDSCTLSHQETVVALGNIRREQRPTIDLWTKRKQEPPELLKLVSARSRRRLSSLSSNGSSSQFSPSYRSRRPRRMIVK